MITVAFYISGHGFGHASRQVEIINALARRAADVNVLIRSSAARWLLDRTVVPPFTLDPEPCDTGVVQIDSLRLDECATIDRAREFYGTFDARVAREAARLRSAGVDLVIGDAPPLASAAAAAAGLPCVIVANFTWDWIYAEYAEYLPSAPRLIPAIRDAYAQALAAWRLPMHGGFESIRNVHDVPLVARHATVARDDTRNRLRLPLATRVALSSFGGYGVHDLDLRALDCLDDWHIVLTGHAAPDALPQHVHFFREGAIYDAGLRYEDVVAACDVVVTKPGYGIVSECIANDTAVVYTSRGRFAEYPVLVDGMRRWLRTAFLDQHDLLAGRWRAALEAAVGAPAPAERPPTNGAEAIADMITALCSADDPFSGPPPPPSS